MIQGSEMDGDVKVFRFVLEREQRGVVNDKKNAPHLFTSIKRNGALFSKGFILGVQFDELFKDNLYFEIAKNAVDVALYFKEKIQEKGYRLYADSYTNQQFIIVPKEKLVELRKHLLYNSWGFLEDGSEIVRIVTSWATKKKEIDELLRLF